MRKYVCSLFVVAALAGASGACVARVYDQPRQDYHRWNSREERAYRAYLAERHRDTAISGGSIAASRKNIGSGGTRTPIATIAIGGGNRHRVIAALSAATLSTGVAVAVSMTMRFLIQGS